MRCCTRVLALLLLPGLLVMQAQERPVLDAGPERPKIDPSELNPKVRAAAETLEKLRDQAKGSDAGWVQWPTPEQWAVVCEACGLHPSLRTFAADTKPFPAVITAGLLTHSQFAVRMGALEILEERTGKDSNFDPWDPGNDASKVALQEWQAWATQQEGGKAPAATAQAAAAAMDEAKMRGYLVDIVGNDVSKQERAMESLALAGMEAVKFLEQYLHDTPQLEEGVRGRIKQAQYRLVLREALPKDAARLARDLIYGTRDQKLAAMQPLPRCRDKAVPILAEYLADPDALIREASMDALILAGGEAVYDLVQERLKTEMDENVIHAVLRRVSTNSERGSKLIASFMTSKNEDLVVASLNALSDGKSQAGKTGVMACISDPRWRVRVAALEYVGKLDIHAADDTVIAAFSDKDEFVRYAAMKAAADMGLDRAVPLITKMALADDSLLGPATDAIVRMGRTLPRELVSALPSKSGEALLSVLRAFGERAGHDGSHIEWSRVGQPSTGYGSSNKERDAAMQALEIVRTLAKHRDADVRETSLQILAQIMPEEEDKRMVLEALQKASTEGKVLILECMQPGPFDFRESLVEEPESPTSVGTSIPIAAPSDIFERVLSEPAPRNEAQEAVYAAFGVKVAPPPTQSPAVAPPQSTPTTPGGRVWRPMDKEFHDVLVQLMTQRENAELAFQAATQLAFGGQRRAIEELHRLLPKLEPHERARLANFLQKDTKLTSLRTGMALLRSLLQDESPEVRGDAVYAVLNKQTAERVRMLLEEVNRPEGNLKAVNAYTYSLVNATEQSSMRGVIQAWATEVLGQPQARSDARTLALVLLGTIGKADVNTLVQGSLTSSDVWQRRAAWRTMMRVDRTYFETNATRMLKDASPRVREVLAAAYTKSETESTWLTWFGERDWDEESVPYRQRSKTYSIPPAMEPLLTQLTRDPDVFVKLQSMFTLLSFGKDVDPLSLREAMAGITDAADRRRLLEPFLQNSFRQLSPRFGFLLNSAEKKWFNDDDWRAMNAQMNPDGAKKSGTALKSFASLVQAPAPAVTASTTPQAAAPVKQATPTSSSTPLRVLFFYKPGCKDCERIRDMLRVIGEAQPLNVEEHNIELSDGAERNQTLAVRFKVEPELHQVTPAVFMQAGALVKTQVTFNALQRLIEKSGEMPPDEGWHGVDAKERATAGGEIAKRFDQFSIGYVALAGLLDGINPCAFATIIFFLSYLHIARRSPREILMVGVAFITAVFLTYFSVGLGLSHVVAELSAFSGARAVLNWLLALTALVLAWLSFRDGVRAMRGRTGESTLQLPEFLKTRIRGVIRVQAKSLHFVAAAFGSGVVISLLELACTGQVYLPTIVYMMRQGSLGAVGWLLLYNIAFVLPLIVIFALAWMGMRSDALIAFQKRNMAMVRFAMGFLFLSLWIVLMVA